MTKNFSFILRTRIVAASALVAALSPLTAFGWTCTDPAGQTWSSNSPSSCAWHYPNCESDADPGPSCLAPNFQKVSSSGTSTTSKTSTSTGATPWTTKTKTSTYTKTNTKTNSYTNTHTQSATSTQPQVTYPTIDSGIGMIGGGMGGLPSIPTTYATTSTDTNTFVATDPYTAVTTETETTAAVSIDDSGISAAVKENAAAFERVTQLQTTMTTEKDHHNEAVAYYRSPERDPNRVAKLLSTNGAPGSGITGGIDENWFTQDVWSHDVKSGISGAKELGGATGVAMDAKLSAKGKFGSSGSAASAIADADVKALMKATLAAKVAQLTRDATLRDKVAALLAADGTDPADPENAALAEALAKAEAASGVSSDGKGETTASLIEKAKAFASLFGSEEKKTDHFSLTSDESQGEVNRLLASIGGDEMATAPQALGEPLFARVHTALNRSVVRGKIFSASAKR